MAHIPVKEPPLPMNKKVLLLMALQKGLEYKIFSQNTANLTDTRLIAQEVWKLLNL
mgnify:CR=1 FL=1